MIRAHANTMRVAALSRLSLLSLLTLLALLALGACDKLPERPAEATYRAADDFEQCRLTAARAILCTNEIMVATLARLGESELAGVVAEDLAKDKKSPKQDRKENIAMHKTSCVAEPGYTDAVFSCWSIEPCKKFADCVVEKSSVKPPPAAPAERAAPADPSAPADPAQP